MSTNTKLGLNRGRSQRGAALVEYAFVLILFLSLLFGISGFGHALYVYHAINNAAKEGTRWAAVNGHNCNNDLTCDGTNGMNNLPASKAQIESYVAAHLPPSLDSSSATVTANFLADSGSPPVCTVAVADPTGPPGSKVGPFDNYPGCTVQVTVQYTYNFMFPLIHTSPVNMSVTSEMVIAH
jgi:Flp pilus assembly protein TadG